MSKDPFEAFKAVQRESWSLFAPLEAWTTIPAAQLVRHARIAKGQKVLDVGCGTGVVAVTAAGLGAEVTGLDLTPALIERAHENASLAGRDVGFVVGDAEALPFPDASFDVVVSQFGHMFAPRAEVALAEMTRVLRPGGTIAFSTWPPEHFVAQMFGLTAKYLPPREGVSPPPLWGDVPTVRARLASAYTEVFFDRAEMIVPMLSAGHYRRSVETTVGPVIELLRVHANDPAKIASFHAELEAIVLPWIEGNTLRQLFLMTRATKRA